MFKDTGFRTFRLKRKDLEKLAVEGKQTDIELVGILYAEEDVTPELIEKTVSSTKIYGRILATPPVRQALLARDTI